MWEDPLKKWLRITLFISLFSISVSSECISENFWLNRVIDGDTFEVTDVNGKKIQIDLAGIDAPEMPAKNKIKGQPFSQKAFKALSELILDKSFSYKAYGKTIDNRILAVVHSEGKNVNLELLKEGRSIIQALAHEKFRQGACAGRR